MEDRDIFRHVIAVYHVQNHVDTLAPERRHEVGRAMVDRSIRAGAFAGPTLLVAARGRKCLRPEKLRELQGHQPDAAGAAVLYEQRFTGQ